MIDVLKEEFNSTTGTLNSIITIYCPRKQDVNKHILNYITEKDYSQFDYIYNQELGSTIDIQGKDNNNGSYVINLTIKYTRFICYQFNN